MNFTVIDNKTGEYPDLWEIATEEEWAKGLMYCDMEGFALLEDGTLILLDECGRFEYCPSDRFTVVFEEGDVVPKSEVERLEAKIKQYELDTYYSVCREDDATKRTAKNIIQRIEDVFEIGYGGAFELIKVINQIKEEYDI